ncbi:MAG: NAD(P)/FAD-dependent oxidoreductase [Negativicutes bacterium]|nr:NAD(P)/FAD-dependent oxidoreductase [Negativicutes bacterium]
MVIAVIGGGPAGLMAAISAASIYRGRVTVWEKMPQVGRKLLITGKGRCNLTNTADIERFVANFPGNGKFLYRCLRDFSSQDLCRWLAGQGVGTKVERGGRVFPVSDRAADVVRALVNGCRQQGVTIRTGCRVIRLLISDQRLTGLQLASGEEVAAAAAVVATGGASYPATGSTGDGYRLLAGVGHSVTEPRPALAPLVVAEPWVADLEGLSLRNVAVSLWQGTAELAGLFGEMVFTANGVSGPVILTMSRLAGQAAERGGQPVRLLINLKPALSPETLDLRLQRDFDRFGRRQFKNALSQLLPRKLIPVAVMLSGIDPDKPASQISRSERQRLQELLCRLTLTVTGVAGLEQAIVTAGGVSVKEVDPRTMGSKKIAGLYIAGELLDIDGNTGGFNLQAAFSTGWLAGRSAAAGLV